MKSVAVIVAGVVLGVAGCSSSSGPGSVAGDEKAVQATQSGSQAPSPSEAFLTQVRSKGLGDKDLSNGSLVLPVGRQLCKTLDTAASFNPAQYGVLVDIAKLTGASQEQAENLVTAAVRDLCPAHLDVLPQS